MNGTRFRLLALLMALASAWGAVGCSSDDSETAGDNAGDNAGDSASVDDTADASGGSGLLDISSATADGSTLDLADFAGQDLMLWFWAPW